jgi:hypothetical protein
MTIEQITKRAQEIFDETYTVEDILKMNVAQAKKDCFEQACKELTNN